MPDGAAELVFQVISERNERGSLIVTTNLPFGEWTKVFPDARLAKAVVDRITHKAHIIDHNDRPITIIMYKSPANCRVWYSENALIGRRFAAAIRRRYVAWRVVD